MNKIVNFIDKIAWEAENDISNLMNWIKKEEPIAALALIQGYKITSAFITAAKSPKGIIIEDLIASVIPQSKAWTNEAIALATEMGQAMQACSGKLPAIEGIALMYCSKLYILIEGEKTTIDNAIIKVQGMFISSR